MDLLLDTNLLTRCIEPGHPLHGTATAAIKELSARNDRLCIVPQVLYEQFVVCTRPPGAVNRSAIHIPSPWYQKRRAYASAVTQPLGSQQDQHRRKPSDLPMTPATTR
jgi:hypothetical protein